MTCEEEAPSSSVPVAPLASRDSEEHVLACCFIDGGETLTRARAALTPESFHYPELAILFRQLSILQDDSLPLDPATLVERRGPALRGLNPLLLTQLTDPDRYPTTAHAGRMIDEVASLAHRRALVAYSRALEQAATSGGPLPQPPRLAAPATAGLQARPLSSFNLPTQGDPSILIGNRYLSRGDIAILASTSGMGKSSLSVQAATTWALGRPLFGGFAPNGPLKSLFFQAEDGDGDIAEVRHSLEHAMALTPEERDIVSRNVLIVTDRVHRGLSFRAELQRQIAIHKPDLVWINPLLAFIGGDVNDSTDVGLFIREQLNSLNEPPQFAYVIVHHTAKPPKEKAQRQWNEVMYEMAGSADLTNAARAIMSLQALDTPGEFALRLAKRGLRAGCTKLSPTGNVAEPTTDIFLRHSKDRMTVSGQTLPVIFWEQFDRAAAARPSAAPRGRKRQYDPDELISSAPAPGAPPMSYGSLLKKIAERPCGISDRSFRDMVADWVRNGELEVISSHAGQMFRRTRRTR